MTVREKLESMLVSNGMFESQAKEVMEMAMPILNNKLGFDDGEPIYQLTYDRPASEYPEFLYPLLFHRLKPIALKWIDENKPAAWFRDMFVTDDEPEEISTPAVIDREAGEIIVKKPVELSTKTKILVGIGIMAAAFAGIAYIMATRPKKEIEKYNRNPRIKKPRKARRQLRRRAQRLDPRSGHYRGIK